MHKNTKNKRRFIARQQCGKHAFLITCDTCLPLGACRRIIRVPQSNCEFIRNSGQGETFNRKYMTLKLRGGQAYGRSIDKTAVTAGATNNRAWSAVLSLEWEQPCMCWIYIHLITCKMQIIHTDDRIITVVILANDRPVLSSERAPHIKKPATVWQK
jgi:hypothetical protein